MTRYWELDFTRGVAIVLMIIFHLMFDLNYFGVTNFNFGSTSFRIFRLSIPTLFLVLVGISLTISYSRVKKIQKKKKFLKYLKRGIKIFSFGLFITISTFILLKKGTIVFGILHLIGVSIILAYPFLEFKHLNLFLGFLIIFFSPLVHSIEVNNYFLLFLGAYPKTFYSLDFFPIFPWFGLVLVGVFLGNHIYPNGKRKINIPEIDHSLTEFMKILGRNSLKIYLVHQPIIILILIFLGINVVF